MYYLCPYVLSAPTCATPTTGAGPLLFTSALQFFAASQCILAEGSVPTPDIQSKYHYF